MLQTAERTQRPAQARLQGVFTQAYRAILDGKADLPSLPRVAIRLSELMRDGNYTTEKIVRIVQTDPASAAYLLRSANSALYRRRVSITDLATAINRFGANTTRNLLLTFSMRSMFSARNPVFRHLMESIWQEAMLVGATAAVIARRLQPRLVDEALLAGLLHNIGALPLILQLQDKGFGEDDAERLNEALERYSPTVGVALLDNWHLDEGLKDAVRHSHDWSYQSPGDLDLVDIVLLARLHAKLASGHAAGCPRLIDLPVFEKLPQEALSPSMSLSFIEEAREEIHEVMALLHG